MIVYSLLGCSGAGKTSLMRNLPTSWPTFNEGYVVHDKKSFLIDNSLHVSKFRYLSNWYTEIIKTSKRAKAPKFVVTDRCPFDVGAYANAGNLLHASAQQCERELQSEFGIGLVKIYARCGFDQIWDRVCTRLRAEPWRKKYHEDDRDFQLKAFHYFETNRSTWNFELDASRPLEEVSQHLEAFISQHFRSTSSSLKRNP